MEVSVLGTWVVAFPNNSFCRDKVEYTVTKVMNQEAFVIQHTHLVCACLRSGYVASISQDCASVLTELA